MESFMTSTVVSGASVHSEVGAMKASQQVMTANEQVASIPIYIRYVFFMMTILQVILNEFGVGSCPVKEILFRVECQVSGSLGQSVVVQ